MSKKRENIVYWLGDSLYLNITNRCPNRCYFCFRYFWDGIASFRLKLSSEPSAEQVIEELKEYITRKKWKEIVFCGFGEPTARLDCLLEVTRWIKKCYPSFKVRLNTNGQALLLNRGRDVISELKSADVDIVSVSLNGHDEEAYNRICRPVFKEAYKSVINFVHALRDAKMDIEITVVDLPEINTSKIRDFAEKVGAKFRLREFLSPIY
ncbi:MAG: TatD family nuclease-associated radical SAM protein [Candidatus Bathyarchaeia archaeon]